ncbi:hypothetical protein A3Q56_02246 [Intoshia linei]|uniref:Uncharacterized protein n=1 Tax=Intoshia linei TaxID=1819745 RepID=A0A177B6Z4_9BILA|nr:hypothetical protein A3Q56_02246 [Intoshia linei]
MENSPFPIKMCIKNLTKMLNDLDINHEITAEHLRLAKFNNDNDLKNVSSTLYNSIVALTEKIDNRKLSLQFENKPRKMLIYLSVVIRKSSFKKFTKLKILNDYKGVVYAYFKKHPETLNPPTENTTNIESISENELCGLIDRVNTNLRKFDMLNSSFNTFNKKLINQFNLNSDKLCKRSRQNFYQILLALIDKFNGTHNCLTLQKKHKKLILTVDLWYKSTEVFVDWMVKIIESNQEKLNFDFLIERTLDDYISQKDTLEKILKEMIEKKCTDKVFCIKF